MAFPLINSGIPTNSLLRSQSGTEGSNITPSFEHLGPLATNTLFNPTQTDTSNILGPVGDMNTIIDLSTTTEPNTDSPNFTYDFPNFTFHGFPEKFHEELLIRFYDHPLKENFQNIPVTFATMPISDSSTYGLEEPQEPLWIYYKDNPSNPRLPPPYENTDLILINENFIDYTLRSIPLYRFRDTNDDFAPLTVDRVTLPLGYALANRDRLPLTQPPMSMERSKLGMDMVRFTNDSATDGVESDPSVPLWENTELNWAILSDEYLGIPPETIYLSPPLRSELRAKEEERLRIDNIDKQRHDDLLENRSAPNFFDLSFF